jgi:hypothetical protein
MASRSPRGAAAPARLIFLAPLALGVAFCSSSETTSDDACSKGQQIACACPGSDEKGVQVCIDEQSGFGPCTGCPGDEGGAGSSAGGEGGGGAASGGTSSGGTSSGGTSSGGTSSGGTSSGGSSGTASGGTAGAIEAGTCAPGEATSVTSGTCDVVLQDCAAGQTCSVRESEAGPWETYCVDFGDGTAAIGEPCDSHSECAAPGRCTLNRCTRPCCANGEEAICGPTGDCDLQITYAGGAAFLQVCTFSPPCTPWAGDCPPGAESDCHIDSDGGFSCSWPNYDPDAGPTLGQPCSYLNDCDDSQHCVYESGASQGTCRWLCKTAADGPDSGILNGPPGQGGCESGQSCKPFASPSWLGYCD